MSTDATPVVARCPLAALERDGQRWAGDGVVVVRQRGRLHAFAEQCPHGGASLAAARVERGAVVCPRHGARFRLRDGKPLSGPARRPLPCFDAAEDGSRVLVRSSAAPADAAPRRSWRGLLGALLRPVGGSECALSTLANGMFGFVGTEPSSRRTPVG